MGFFSFNTCDTDESVPNEFVSHKNSGKPVYMLQPNGDKPIEEKSYEGYGVIGGVDVYEWLARKNISDIPENTDPEDVRTAGIYLDSVDFYVLGNVVAYMKKPDFFAAFLQQKFCEKFTNENGYVFVQADNYDTPIEEMGGLTLNQLGEGCRKKDSDIKSVNCKESVSYTHLTLPTIYSV